MKIITTYYEVAYNFEDTYWNKIKREDQDLITDKSLLDVMLDEIGQIYKKGYYTDITLIPMDLISKHITFGKEAVGFSCEHADSFESGTGLKVIYVAD